MNCLGALDWTYIKMNVPHNDRPMYRTHKGEISTNVLIFVLVGWEGCGADSRILWDALARLNGLKVLKVVRPSQIEARPVSPPLGSHRRAVASPSAPRRQPSVVALLSRSSIARPVAPSSNARPTARRRYLDPCVPSLLLLKPGSSTRAPATPILHEADPTASLLRDPRHVRTHLHRAARVPRLHVAKPHSRVSHTCPCRAAPSAASRAASQPSRFTYPEPTSRFLSPASQWSRQASFNPILTHIFRCPLGFTKDQLVPTGSQIARVRGRTSSGAEVEVKARASWRATRSDRGEP
ncbi:putative nuclease HARBI1 [Cucumis melo var. makuwa]|uniref:Nuclease HARBI1 n=1 Tax=Cucumis melo var. makuwa TaxID=1194695 RepID=A0A5D3DTW8_CUCMM|nr:putative nuclease HARBI1 [Cucumis melo var. makuwa]TYK27083.1 putative nuclease HARBI1 [Cucumis melo var. makuwa]